MSGFSKISLLVGECYFCFTLAPRTFAFSEATHESFMSSLCWLGKIKHVALGAEASAGGNRLRL